MPRFRLPPGLSRQDFIRHLRKNPSLRAELRIKYPTMRGGYKFRLRQSREELQGAFDLAMGLLSPEDQSFVRLAVENPNNLTQDELEANLNAMLKNFDTSSNGDTQ